MKSVIIHYQEIALKGKNRPWFVARLVRNIRESTRDLDIKEVRVLMGRIELVEPTQRGSSLDRFLEERGEGIHHLCFLVDSLDETCRVMEAAGYRLAGGIRGGSEGTRIAFLHPRGTGGVLIELREDTEGKA